MKNGSRDWIFQAIELLRRGLKIALVTQCAVEGSAPREPGAKMIVSGEKLFGSIGGGNLENLAINQARKLILQSEKEFVVQDHPLGPLLAQCCGGHVRILIEILTDKDLEWLKMLTDLHGASRELVRSGDAIVEW